MRKYLLVFVVAVSLSLSGCDQTSQISCGEGTIKVDGQCVVEEVTCNDGFHIDNGTCVVDEVTCNDGFHNDNGTCVVDEVTCNEGYHESFGTCVVDELTCDVGLHVENNVCVIDTEVPDWFEGWSILSEPVGDKTINDLNFTETGLSVFLEFNARTGIHLSNLTFEPGYSYEVKFDYSSAEAGKGLFVQLQAHSGYYFTNPAMITSGSDETFSQTLAYPFSAPGTTDGSLSIEFTPSGVVGTISIENIEIIKTPLPTCGENQVLKGLECVAANNGFEPNGTPTAWFEGWNILSVPTGDKEVSDYDFTETGFTVYLAVGERSGIELMDYVFESGYTYELSFDYTSSEALRMIWVQMEALGGYGFTNTDTWSVEGTGTFTQSLTIPSTYTPDIPGWIKLELAPGGMDNITIDNIVITKTAN